MHRTFQAEPGGVGIDELSMYNIYHYTFDLDVAQWAWSKRRFMTSYPPRLTDPPDRGLTDPPDRRPRASVRTFVSMINEAIDSFGDGWRPALKPGQGEGGSLRTGRAGGRGGRETSAVVDEQ